MKNTISIVVLLFSLPLLAQHMGSYHTHTMHSAAFGKELSIKVYRTEAVEEVPEDRVAVLCVLDGQYEPFWGMVTQMVNYLSSVQEFPQVLVVGIVTEHRPLEFTPAPEDERTRGEWGETTVGNAATLEAHLREEVFPWVESQYNVTPLRIGIGHSLGGTFMSNSLFDKQGLFNAVLSISPNMEYDYALLPKKLERLLSNTEVPMAWHYLTVGSEGSMEQSFRTGARRAHSIFGEKPHPNLTWHYKEYEGEGHMTTPILSLLDGLRAFNDFWTISAAQCDVMLADSSRSYLAHLQAHFEAKGRWAGYTISLSADEINDLAYAAAYAERWADALDVIDWALDQHPNDPNLYDSKGECLENLGQKTEALQCYMLAMDTLEREKHRFDEEQVEYYNHIFNLNAQRVKEALESR